MRPRILIVYLDQTSCYEREADGPSQAKDKDRNVKALCNSGFFDKPFEFSHGISCSAESYAKYNCQAEEGKYPYLDTFTFGM
jgi:hypothetical protein